MHHKESRATLGGKLSAVLVAAGSSVGLGNIWRFPYVAGDNGGGAFLIIYILCVLLLGLPLMIAEFSVGRASHLNAVGAYRKLNRRWSFLGYNGVLAAFLILGFYFVVSGWTAEYMVHSATGEIARYSTAEEYKNLFETFISNPWRPVLYTCLFVLATHFVIALGVQKGIERSAKILMPLLFVILIILSVHSLLMPGGEAGLKFLFAPDFSKVTPTTVLVALGQAFFSLSIGIGTMVTYASYFKPDTNLRHTALNDPRHAGSHTGRRGDLPGGIQRGHRAIVGSVAGVHHPAEHLQRHAPEHGLVVGILPAAGRGGAHLDDLAARSGDGLPA